MIQVTRSLLRRLRSVFCKAGVSKPSAGSRQGILFQADSDGLRVRAMSDSVAVEYHEPGKLDAVEMWVPAQLLATAEGRSDDLVTLDLLDGRALATWTDGGIPQRYACDERPEPERVSVFPACPKHCFPTRPSCGTASSLPPPTSSPASGPAMRSIACNCAPAKASSWPPMAARSWFNPAFSFPGARMCWFRRHRSSAVASWQRNNPWRSGWPRIGSASNWSPGPSGYGSNGKGSFPRLTI